MDGMTRISWLAPALALTVALVVVAGCGSARPGVAQVTASGGWDASALGRLAAAEQTTAPTAQPTEGLPGAGALTGPALTGPAPSGALPDVGATTFPVAAGAGSGGVTGATPGASSGVKPVVGPGTTRPAPAVAATGVVAPAQTRPDLVYARGSVRQTLDLMLPRRTGRPVPLVIVVHGGAFLEGDKADVAATVQALVQRGYAAAAVNYRYSSEATFPAAVKDVKAAVRYLRAQAPAYGIDPGRIGIWGESAGGYLAAMVGATTGRSTEFDDPALGNAGVSSDVQAVVDWYGPINFTTMDAQTVSPGGCPGVADSHGGPGSPESLLLGAPVRSVPGLAAAANPITYLPPARRLPRFLVVHGTADCQVPQGQSIEFAAALRSAGAQVTLTLMDGAGHGGAAFVTGQQSASLDFLDGVLHG